MSDRPVFLYAAIYDEIDDAEADYEAVFDLHAAGAIGTFDSAVIRKEEDGKVRVTKTEKPTQHGAWTGAGVGALVGIIFPPAILGSAIVGAGAGGLIGHLRGGVSRDDLKELGDELEAGSAAVIVIGESKIEEQLEKAITRANKLIEKQIDADADELKREIEAAAKEDARLGAPPVPRIAGCVSRSVLRARGWSGRRPLPSPLDPPLPCIPGTGACDGRRLARSGNKALPPWGALVLTGTIFYWRFEDWTIIQALYFSVVTLTRGSVISPRPPPVRRSSRSFTSSPGWACSSPC